MGKIVLTGFKFKHHGAHTGYDQLQQHIPGAVWVNRDDFDHTVPSWWQKRGFARINLYLERWRDWRYQLSLKRALRGAEVVHFLYPENTLANLPFQIDPAVKVIATFHQPVAWWEEVLKKPRFEQELTQYKRVNTAIVLSSDLEEVIKEGLGIKDVRFVPHGVDGDFFKPGDHNRLEQVVLVLGSWMRDLDLLEGVIEHSLKANGRIAFRLLISPYHHQRFARFDRVLCMSGLNDSELLLELQQASLLFLPLTGATANNALLEAASCALPVMATQHRALLDYFSEEQVLYFGLELHQKSEIVSKMLLDYLSNIPTLEYQASSLFEQAKQYHWNSIAFTYQKTYEA